MLKDKKKKIIKALIMTSFLLTQGVKGKNEEIFKDNVDNITYQELNNKGYLTSNVNFRTGPNTSYKSIKVLQSYGNRIKNLKIKSDIIEKLVDF